MCADSIDLVGREMCEECDAFLGKEHRIGCSLSGPVTAEQATEKFTTMERVQQEEPLIGLDPDTVEMILRWFEDLDLDDPEEIEKLQALRGGLETFVAAAREVEGGGV